MGGLTGSRKHVRGQIKVTHKKKNSEHLGVIIWMIKVKVNVIPDLYLLPV